MANISGIIELVKLNQGISILAPWTVDSELVHGSLKMRPVGTKPLNRKWAVISLASRRMTLAEETFCKLCRSTTAGMRMDRNDLPLPFDRAPRNVMENARIATV